MKKITKIFVALIAVFSLGVATLSPVVVQANREQDLSLCIAEGGTVSGTGANMTCTRPGDARTVEGVIPTVMNVVFFFIGVSSVVMIVYGSVLLVKSRGGEDVKNAKNVIIWSVVGLVVAMLAYAIVRWTFGALSD